MRDEKLVLRVMRRRALIDADIARDEADPRAMSALAAAPLDVLREYNAIAEEIIGHDEAVLLDDLSVEATPLVHALLIFIRLKDATAMMRGVLARADARGLTRRLP